MPTPTPKLPSYASYAVAMQAADAHLTANKPDFAKSSFDAAMLLATDDEQRADVHFGLAKVHIAKKSRVRKGSDFVDQPNYYSAMSEYEKAAALKAISPAKRRSAYDKVIEIATIDPNPWRIASTYDAMIKAFPDMPLAEKVGMMFKKAEAYPLDNRSNATSAFQAYQAITTLAGVGDTDKAKALMKMADLEYRFGNKQAAFQLFSSAGLTAGATAEQRATATLQAGKMLWELGQADQAQAMMNKVVEMKDAPAANKADAHTMLASSYGHQKKADMQLAEFAKIPSIKGVSDEHRSKAYYSMGDLHMKAERYAAARAEFKKIFSLKDAKNAYVAVAYYYTGKAFEKEKNAKEARAAWTKMVSIAENAQYKNDALAALADSFREEKKYADAAKALIQRAAIDKLWDVEKQDALLDLGDVYLDQKDAAKAADTYAQAAALKPKEDKGTGQLRALTGIIEARRLQGDAARTAEAQGALAELIQRSNFLPVDERTAKLKEMWDLADASARNDATVPTALAIYEGILKGNADIVVSTSNRVHLAVADILIRQKKLADAKARLQKVTVSRFPNSEELKKQVAEANAKMQSLP